MGRLLWPIFLGVELVKLPNFIALLFTFFYSLAAISQVGPMVEVSPQFIPLGKSVELRVKLQDGDAQKMVISPGGPYEKLVRRLNSAPKDITTAYGKIYVALGAEGIAVLDSDLQGAAQYKKLGDVMSVTGEDDRLLLVKRGGEVEMLALPTLEVLSSKSIRFNSVTDVSLSAGHAVLLLDGHRVLDLSLDEQGNLYKSAELVLQDKAFSVSVSGNYAYAAQGRHGLAIIDLLKSEVLGSCDTPGEALDVAVGGEFAYVADGEVGLTVLDVSQKNNIKWHVSYNKIGAISKVQLFGSQLMVVNQGKRLGLFDVKRASNPLLKSLLVHEDPLTDILFVSDQVVTFQNRDIKLVDFADAAMPPINIEGMNLGGTRRMALDGDLAYVADWFSGVHVYDISNPKSLKHVANFHTPGSAKGTLVKDHYLFVGDDDQGLQVVDISDLANIRAVAHLPSTGLAYTMKRQGDVLFLADHRGGFDIIDIKNPEKPELLSRYKTPGKSWAVAVKGNVLYVADDGSGLLVFDISDLKSPKMLTRFSPGGHAEDVVLRGDYAYVTFFDGGLYILDIKNPQQPKQVSHLPTYGNARGVVLHEEYAYVADWDAGLLVVNVSDVTQPVIVGHMDTVGSVWGVDYKDGHVIILDWWGGFKMADVRNPTAPTLVGRYHAGDVINRLSIKDNYLFAAAGQRGLQVFDIKNPLGPIWQTGVDLPGTALDLSIANNKAYVALAEGGLAVVDVANPLHAKLVTVEKGYSVKRVFAEKQQLVMQLKNGQVVLAEDNKKTGVTQWAMLQDDVEDLSLNGSFAFLLLKKGGVKVFDVSVGKEPLLVAWYKGVAANNMLVDEEYLYTYKQGRGLSVYLREGKQLTQLGSVTVDGEVTGMHVAESLLYVATNKPEMLVLKASKAGQFHISQVYPSAENISDIVVNKQAAFLAGGEVVASTLLMPAIEYKKNENVFTAQLSGDLPDGSYHVRLLGKVEGSSDSIYYNAFKIGIRRAAKPKLSMEAFQQLLQKHYDQPKAK